MILRHNGACVTAESVAVLIAWIPGAAWFIFALPHVAVGTCRE
jgi:hypothetical protein